MNQGQNKLTKNKISNEFAARLDRLGPGETVRAIVFLEVKSSEKPGISGRQSRSQRKAAVERVRQAAENALKEIDNILKRFEGRRLDKQPTALGSVLVETTAAGVYALAKLAKVKTIIEDQGVSLIP
ncbi:MAG: hypothetical protein JSV88_08095 [Candidatus Aminicenantes bacterium]|nr:MAG: hypothetical protein JSV88_08095 [Candidatus Aminicenantes bacterium]